jgi:spoIIIJ-associated protein
VTEDASVEDFENESVEDSVRDLIDQMLDHLDWDLDVEVDGDDPETLKVELYGEDREILIRNEAEVLEVFQYLTNRIFGRELSDRRIVVDCEGFRARKEAELIEVAARVSERVLRTGEEEELARMNPYERRIVHLAVAELEGVTTESEGDGVMKRVIILPT